ncbi:hypothetical protein D3C87_1757730 [compost metagenome]
MNSLTRRAGTVIAPGLTIFAPICCVVAISRFVAATSKRLLSVRKRILLRIGNCVLLLATRPTALSAFARFSWVTVSSIIVITFLLIFL